MPYGKDRRKKIENKANLPNCGRKPEILNPKYETYGFRKKCKTKPILWHNTELPILICYDK